ncbi:hypothetical protein SLEP1_g2511 [Rubroshorea leprosula]|uniref:Reverse transcriptase domain-containing protein n=1 Tax=Rubroshorea leprosula TaxID=152421 RepID=A0AAV5HRY1_9ROSI|nr:hypothetical protein SLEP1_g2511 [Rubroshorea leprosula]
MGLYRRTSIRWKQNNYIFQLKNEHGQWLKDTKSIISHTYSQFQQAYASSNTCNLEQISRLIHPSVMAEMNHELCRSVSDDEIRSAVFQLGVFRVPGVDGFPGCFYQQHWDLVGPDVCKAIRHFFEHGFMLREMNRTKIVLILKIKAPESAFILSRAIQDNILIAHEAFHGLQLKKSGKHCVLALKLDIRKAYDSVDWHSLEHILRAYGFCEQWIHMVMPCVSTVSYTVGINGNQTPNFVPQKGLRQGDPLSSYLYLFIADLLSRLLMVATIEKKISGYKIRMRSPTISHLLFADDSLVFCRATAEEVNHLQTILQLYDDITGQRVNYSKSAAVFSPNIPKEVRESICEHLGIRLEFAISKYLGLPTSWGRSKKDNLKFVVVKIQKKLAHWKKNLLSQASREVLIKAVAMAIPTFTMSCFLFPMGVCREINRLIKDFWWGQQMNERKPVKLEGCYRAPMPYGPVCLKAYTFQALPFLMLGKPWVLTHGSWGWVILWNGEAKNEKYFEQAEISPSQVLTRISHMLQELSLDHQDLLESPSRSQPPAQQCKSSWSRPPCGIIKVNVDASFSPNSEVAALAMVECNSNGEISFGRTWCYSASTPLSVEVAALLKAVRFAEDKGFQDIIFESDNQVLISSIQQSSKPLPWEAQSLIISIRQSCISNPGFKFNFVPRLCNQVADWVACTSLSGQCPSYWAHCPPKYPT